MTEHSGAGQDDTFGDPSNPIDNSDRTSGLSGKVGAAVADWRAALAADHQDDADPDFWGDGQDVASAGVCGCLPEPLVSRLLDSWGCFCSAASKNQRR